MADVTALLPTEGMGRGQRRLPQPERRPKSTPDVHRSLIYRVLLLQPRRAPSQLCDIRITHRNPTAPQFSTVGARHCSLWKETPVTNDWELIRMTGSIALHIKGQITQINPFKGRRNWSDDTRTSIELFWICTGYVTLESGSAPGFAQDQQD